MLPDNIDQISQRTGIDMSGILHSDLFKIADLTAAWRNNHFCSLRSHHLQHLRTGFTVNLVNNPLPSQNQNIAPQTNILMQSQSHPGRRSHRNIRQVAAIVIIFFQPLRKSSGADNIFSFNAFVCQILVKRTPVNHIVKIQMSAVRHCLFNQLQPFAFQIHFRAQFSGCGYIYGNILDTAGNNRRNNQTAIRIRLNHLQGILHRLFKTDAFRTVRHRRC